MNMKPFKYLVLAGSVALAMVGTADVALAKGHATMSKAQIEAAQTALNGAGESLSVDGHWGTKSRVALKHYQTSHGLKATGRLDAATKKALNV